MGQGPAPRMVMVSPGRLMGGRGGSVGRAGSVGRDKSGRVGKPPPSRLSTPEPMAPSRPVSTGGSVGSPIAGSVGSAGKVKLAGSFWHVVVVLLLPLMHR